MGRDLSLLLPELVLAGAAMLMIVAEMARAARVALGVALAALAISALLTLQVLQADTTVFGGTYRIAMISGWAKLILLPGTALSLLMTRAEIAGREREGSVYALIVLVTLGALMLSGGGDLMLLVLGVVLTGLGSFALVAWPRDDAATEAAMKYLIFGAVTGAVMIYGLSFWFGGTGSTLYSALERLNGPVIAMAGLVAVIVGLGYKAALVPFHFWAPDAYQGAPVSIAAYLSVITKTAAFFAFAQILRDLPRDTGWPVTLALVSAATMTYGYLAALVQTNLVRLIAYSSVAQSGYFLLGVVALGVSPFAVPGLLVFAGAYVAMNLGAFAVIMVAGRELSDLEGLGRARPQLAVAMVIFLLSLTGIPPLFGFVGKFYLFTAALDAGFLWVAVIAILNSVLSLGVYLRMVVPMFRKAEGARTAVPVSSPLVVVLAVTVAVTLSFGVLAGFVPS
ncbi:NADH-quinone oxidoreductase subunit N (plasmid) [Nitratireductor rhodophyticola]|jgi:NADH-quinone oxidoreductase subunit N|uniref:NADH-quinone oxidoreductase subunit N n=1 Tax=Nitratireductor TaxID=245876 RepID=UPI000C8F0B16|nr:NADH-quinone oxidoreductase subunit N [Nitratireductor rhodophyticola]MAS15449.1 oxidoreductase [Nitratireductor sp.]MEC9245856.1 NADH-quinone oxidoreductase subunit N [Pseudomonadota bacterium]WPZ16427.1 NADH-quinone oxidoreductase subunit N [Nitratireductor rhodophyticola]